MTMLALILAFAGADLTGGSTDCTWTFPDFVPSSATSAFTPGSESWYADAEIDLPKFARVWTNGVELTNSPACPVVSYVTNGVQYGEFRLAWDITDTLQPGDEQKITNGLRRIPFRPGQFDGTWGTRACKYYVVVTNFETVSSEEVFGTNLLWMTAHRASADLYAGLCTSYAGYYERLLACENDGSLPSVNSNQFDYVAPPDDRQRLLRDEYVNLTNLNTHVLNMMGALDVTVPVGVMRDDEQAFGFSSGWITDGSSATGNTARIWWSSTRLPPFVMQDLGGGYELMPDENDFKDLLPSFDWKEYSIAYPDGLGAFTESVPWQTSCLTLGTLLNRTTDHPAKVLYQTIYDPSAGPLDMIRTYSYANDRHWSQPWGFLRATYPRCERALPDADDAIESYVAESWSVSRRLRPGTMVGINQLLGVMDRLIHIPSQHYAIRFDRCEGVGYGDYEADGPQTIDLKLDDYSQGRFAIDGMSGTIDCRKTYGSGYFKSESEGVTQDELVFALGPVSGGNVKEPTLNEPEFSGYVDLTSEEVERMRIEYDIPSGEDIYIDGLSGVAAWPINVVIDFHATSIPSGEHVLIATDLAGVTGEINPSFSIERSYDYELPFRVEELVVQPVLNSDGRGTLSCCWLDRKDFRMTPGPRREEFVHYRSKGSEGSDDIAASVEAKLNEMLDEIYDDSRESDDYGGWDAPEYFAPVPNSVTVSVDADETTFVAGDIGVDILWPENPYVVHEIYCATPLHWDCDFMADVAIASVSNAYYEATNAVATVISIQTEEGWVFSEGWTNLNGRALVRSESSITTNAPLVTVEGQHNEIAEFWDCQRDRVVLQFPLILTTNVYYQTFATNGDHTVVSLETTNIFIAATGEATTNVTHDAYSIDSVETYDEPAGIDVWQSWADIRMTGQECIDQTTGGIYEDRIVEYYPTAIIHPDNTWSYAYTEAHTGELIVEHKGSLPIRIARVYGALIPEDLKINVESEMPSAFNGSVRDRRTIQTIYCKDFNWKSMHRTDK